MLAPPTLCTVELFVPALCISEALGIARAQSLEPIRPFVTFDAGELVLAMPGDPLYPGQEPRLASRAIPARFVLEKGRLVGRRSV
jgi:hypothetical protein